MSKKILGMDFGTGVFKIYRKDEGVVLSEKTVIAIEKDRFETPGIPYKENKRVKAVGDVAFEMMEKAPVHITVSYPVHNGVIADLSNMKLLLEHFLDRLLKKERARKGFVYIVAVPTDITEVEKRAFYDIMSGIAGKGKNIFLVEKPIAAALGLGIDPVETQGSMIVDMGADTTEISIVSMGGIVNSKLSEIGGSSFDEAIKTEVRRRHRLQIGDRTAEQLKLTLCDALGTMKHSTSIYGMNIVTGLPVKAEIDAQLVYDAMKAQLSQLMENVQVLLERTPPEISAQIRKDGIYLTGGSSGIRNLVPLFSEQTGLLVNHRADKTSPVVSGLGRIMEQASFSHLKYIPKHAAEK